MLRKCTTYRGQTRICHPTKVAAIQALARCRAKGRDECAYYRCKRCGDFHLTSQDPATIGLVWDPKKGVIRV